MYGKLSWFCHCAVRESGRMTNGSKAGVGSDVEYGE